MNKTMILGILVITLLVTGCNICYNRYIMPDNITCEDYYISYGKQGFYNCESNRRYINPEYYETREVCK